MNVEERLARLEKLAGVTGDTKSVADPIVLPKGTEELLAMAKALPPEVKVALLEAMGFTPTGSDHNGDCDTPFTGNRCNCVPPATVWSQPHDVDVFRKETWEERLAEARKRK